MNWEGFSHFADLVGVVSAIVSVVIFFKTRGIRDRLHRRFALMTSVKELEQLIVQFEGALKGTNRLDIKKEATGVRATLERLQKFGIALDANDAQILRGVESGTSDEHEKVVVLLTRSISAVNYALEDDTWSR